MIFARKGEHWLTLQHDNTNEAFVVFCLIYPTYSKLTIDSDKSIPDHIHLIVLINNAINNLS